MKKQISLIAALFLSVCGLVQADTSYLLIQGPFGTLGATETFKWEVNYTAGTLRTGYDLLNAALTSSEFQRSYNAGLGYSIDSFTLQGTVVAPTADWSKYWLYYTASATAGSWTVSDSGMSSTILVDGSYDGFVYGGSTYNPTTTGYDYDPIAGADNTPTTANFATATQVEAVPEPGSIALVFTGAAVALALRRKLRKS